MSYYRRDPQKEKFVFIIINVFFFLRFFLGLFITGFSRQESYFIDNVDPYIFFGRSQWILFGYLPYSSGEGLEFPQLTTYFIALPLLFTNDLELYYILLKTQFMITSYLNIIVLYKILLRLKLPIIRLIVFIFPSMLYFSFCRYDPFAALLLNFSFYFLIKKKNNQMSFFLACSFWAKWYAIIAIPVIFRYFWNIAEEDYIRQNKSINEIKELDRRKDHRFQSNTISYTFHDLIIIFKKTIQYLKFPIIIFILTSVIILIPSLISFKLDRLVFAYLFHLSRGTNNEGLGQLFNILFNAEQTWTLNIGDFNISYWPLLLTQFIIIPFLFFFPTRKLNDVFLNTSFGILWFILFAKFQSPQWIWWIVPVLTLIHFSKREWKILVIILLFWGMSNLVVFIWRTEMPWFWFIALIIRYCAQFSLLGFLVKKIKKNP